MAENLNANTTQDPKHNIKAMNATIQNGFKERFKQEMEIADAEERHIKPLKDALKKLKRDMKTDTGIDGIDLDNQYRQIKRQEMAKKLDEDAAARIADNMRLVFEAMVEGDQLDFIDSIKE